jgi:L-serine dehydratase
MCTVNTTQTAAPSIFNDVIGPVMRGPSSSHCAAALRIGRIARDLMDAHINSALVEFDRHGSLATTHASQGSDMGLFAGFLGWDPVDERLAESHHALQEAGIQVQIEITDFPAEHPNTYRMTLQNPAEQHTITAISIGGGAVKVTELDGCPVSLSGDYYETLVYLESRPEGVLKFLSDNFEADQIQLLQTTGTYIIEIKARQFLDQQTIAELRANYKIKTIKHISPVLPVLSSQHNQVPFITCVELLQYNQDKDLDLWQLALHYESARGNLSHEQVFDMMQDIVRMLQRSIHTGINGTHYQNRILGYQSGGFKTSMESQRLLDGGILNQIILYTTALMEMKSSMGVIVAAPTAGACGGLPGAVIGAASKMGLPIEDMTRAMLAAGLVGVFVAAHATFAAEVGGCQAECGAGSGMAAAALVTLAGGTTKQALNATSMALQNILGMICDPVANRVEVPCLGKNVLAASNALACANMALAGFDPVIPLDEVIATMDQVGRSLPAALRCTGLGGLSITPTSQEIERRLYSLSNE